MSLAGGALTIVLGGWHIIRGERDKIKIPYGIAIAFGGLWVLWANYVPGVSIAAQSA
jgi:prepilin peptidase CpaA